MKTKRVRWLRTGLEVPGIGVTIEGEKSKPMPISQADEFCRLGVAEDLKTPTEKKPKEVKNKGGEK